MLEPVLVTYNLSKYFKKEAVVKQVSLRINKGDIYGFVGKNGAGKTTTLEMLSALIEPDSGEIELFGVHEKVKKRREMKRMAVLVGEPAYFPKLTAKENLTYFCSQHGIVETELIDKTLLKMGLDPCDKKKARSFSLGMKQRLGLAYVFIHPADLIILDEPTNGLDASSITTLRNLILELNQKYQVTFLIASHLLSELETIATKYGFIHNGALIEELDQQTLAEKLSPKIKIIPSDIEKTIVLLETMVDSDDFEVLPHNVIVVRSDKISVEELSLFFFNEQLYIKEIYEIKPTLEQYFTHLLKEQQRKDGV
ncbi:ATP-binding cassette domain-containing protein [Carnobacterium maltaromaticum]|uniref:ATP-binding cassette domain-containing protein n=1 Tax=Carnobacterium maltaromaticum TaxID=2751 RepID=UPI0009D2CDD1|nr:ATP-binding cassette domain-containing protein [Carnobacterium maltaromaticum]CRH18150.1 ABC transporter family protein [Carnobacterium maltaromaticum]CRH21886.1 ABC transporter family protein [Carnobacterium maltaromaticum]